ncbi:MAG: fatty-acid--CoA ligase [Sphingomonadaceae bacterium]|nr:fatty-acid--CoA ligase [Sphingomonadaceae bacterium]NBU78645.1 fatty-acid--CoA ligase [Sphingomonadaceae bacterium]NCA01323.1 fatty-acid--CoA ligase [Sphingomonadaceae bacterium]
MRMFMLGYMQDWDLRVSHLIDYAAREHGNREILTRWADGSIERTNWAGVALEARKLAQVFARWGMKPGDRIATFAMNHHRHLAAWYGAIGCGGVIHTVNVRLFDEDLIYIMNHAEDRVLMYDAQFQPVIDRLKPHLKTVEHYIVFDSADSYGALMADADGQFDWVMGDERDPCMLCYTSGTTGHPKGVLYQHRSTMLHAMAEIAPSVFDLSCGSVLLPIVPMFHAASWGLPFAGAAAGVKFVFSTTNDAPTLHGLMLQEKVTHSAGVPTVWLAMFQHLDATAKAGRDASLGKLRLVTIGGSAAPRAMIERLMKQGVRVAHAWGMTETSPIGTMGSPTPDWDDLSIEAQIDIVCKQGRVPFGVELRIVDDEGTVLPRDGTSSGKLQVRGPWVVKRYFKAEADATDADQWFDTGDVSVIHPDGTMQITDRAKDVIKSGGEWISSVELENAAVGCPGVAEAAAIGVPHPKWDERPILLVVRKEGAALSEADVVAYLAGVVAKWWLPDEVLFVDSLPHTGTGKIQKAELRKQYKDYQLKALRAA